MKWVRVHVEQGARSVEWVRACGAGCAQCGVGVVLWNVRAALPPFFHSLTIAVLPVLSRLFCSHVFVSVRGVVLSHTQYSVDLCFIMHSV